MKQQNILENKNGGFVALISSIIIGAILMTVALSLGSSSFSTRIDILNVEFKEKSVSLAEACADTAIIKLQSDPDYTPPPIPGEKIIVGDNFCHIVSISGTWPTKTIKIQAAYPSSTVKKSYTNLVVSISKPADIIEVVSWQEIANLP